METANGFNVHITFMLYYYYYFILIFSYKGKAVPLQGWSGAEGSRKLRFPDFATVA